MSLLPTSTFAGPSQAEALWAVAGSVGPGGGVTQLVAGSGITLDPSTGEGVVTINASGGAGGVSSVTASGAGITASPTSGAVVLANTGVTSLVAGTGISLSGASGAVTVTNSFASGLPTLSYQTVAPTTNFSPTPVTADVLKVTIPVNALGAGGYICQVWKEGWSINDVFTISLIAPPQATTTTTLPGSVQCQAFGSGTPLNPFNLLVQYAVTVDGAVGTNNPVVWIIRYAGVVLP